MFRSIGLIRKCSTLRSNFQSGKDKPGAAERTSSAIYITNITKCSLHAKQINQKKKNHVRVVSF